MRKTSQYDDSFLVREGLDENEELVSETQSWFNQLILLYNQEVRSGTLVLHRALFIGIMGHSNTKLISTGKGPIQKGRKTYIIEGNNGRHYYIILHSDDSLTGGYMGEGNSIKALGNEIFQEQGKKLVNKVRRIGFLKFLKGIKENHNVSYKIRKILSNMSDSEQLDIEQALIKIRT